MADTNAIERVKLGWLYVGDDGIEWSARHPVRSGEMPDARLIRRATNAELLAALKDAWEAHMEAVESEGLLRTRWSASEEARRQVLQALEKAEGENERLRAALKIARGGVLMWLDDLERGISPPTGSLKSALYDLRVAIALPAGDEPSRLGGEEGLSPSSIENAAAPKEVRPASSEPSRSGEG